MMLLVGGGLPIRSFVKLSSVDPGYLRQAQECLAKNAADPGRGGDIAPDTLYKRAKANKVG